MSKFTDTLIEGGKALILSAVGAGTTFTVFEGTIALENEVEHDVKTGYTKLTDKFAYTRAQNNGIKKERHGLRRISVLEDPKTGKRFDPKTGEKLVSKK